MESWFRFVLIAVSAFSGKIIICTLLWENFFFFFGHCSQERNENIQNQPLYSKRQKLQKMNFSDKTDISVSISSNGSQDSPGVCGLHFCMKWKLAWFNSSCLGIFRIEVSWVWLLKSIRKYTLFICVNKYT